MNPQKNKGDRAEREIAGILADLLGVNVRRKLGAGRQDDQGDIDGIPSTTVEIKNYADTLRGIREGLTDLQREHANTNNTFAVCFVRRHGGQWIAVQTVEQWATYARETMQ
jgi:Holliday junction resolvase